MTSDTANSNYDSSVLDPSIGIVKLAANGAGIYFLQCIGQGGSIGLIISPLCAAIGAGLGALSAEDEGTIEASGKAIRATLAECDGEIFDKRLVAEDPITLRELGESFGISRERVRQLENELKQRLKQFLEESGGVVDVL